MPSTFLEQIEGALRGAQYHESCAFLFAVPGPSQSYDKLVYHLRAYFWELRSAWDYILQQVNQATMRLDARDVNQNFLAQLRKRNAGYKFLGQLEAIRDSGELRQINRLRNCAHRWILSPQEAIVGENGQVLAVSLLLDEGGARERVYLERHDLDFMRRTVDDLKYVGFL